MTNLPVKNDEDKYMMYERGEDGVLRKYDMRTGEVVSEHGRYLTEGRSFQYSVEWNNIICNEVRAGKTLTSICSQPGFPSTSVVHQWKAAHPDFAKAFAMAKKDRAESFADMVHEIAMNVGNKDDAQVAKVQIDSLKWLAEKNNPVEYGSQTKITGDANAPVGFSIINTGIEKGVQADETEKNRIVETTCEEVVVEEQL